jgi:Na+/H+ antiporter NhaC
MRFRTRCLVALALVGLFAAIPAPDAATGQPYLGFLEVREWLLGEASPLAAHLQQGRLPALGVDLRTSPPTTDPELGRRRVAEYERIAAEWAASQRAAGQAAVVAADGARLPLLVRIGTEGVAAELPGPDGVPQKFVASHATRWSLLPAVIAIGVAVLTRRVLLALLLACLGGGIAYVATTEPGGSPGGLQAVAGGSWHFVADALWRRSLCEAFHLRITLFVVFLFMTIGVISRNGGVHGLVDVLQRRVRGPISAQLCTFAAGIAVFFDDYTNCLLVGTTMRPLSDRSRVSREKLAYIVDSTAAPVAGLSVFSTWVTYEMSQYRAPLALVTRSDGTPYTSADAFEVFLASLPYRCYSLFALALVVLVIVMRRDFGPMLTAERRARRDGKPIADDARPMVAVDQSLSEPTADTPRRARNAVLPLLVLVIGTVVTMLVQGASAAPALPPDSGFGEHVRAILANASSDTALLGAAAAAYLVALLLTRSQQLLTWRQIAASSLAATHALWLAFGILFLAWSLGYLCADLGTSFFLCAATRESMTAVALPLLLFGLAGAIAFATGTSYGTMAILLPNVVVLAHQVGADAAFGGSAAVGGPALMLLSIGAVLEGSIFGDHCSPISDTTVLSSLGSQCDLTAHVTTQLPYALLAFGVSAVCGYLPLVWFGPDTWPWCLAAGVLTMALWLRLCGRDPDRP